MHFFDRGFEMRLLCRPLAASVVVIALTAAGVQAAVPTGPASSRAAHAVAARAPERGAAQAAIAYLYGLCDRLLAAAGLASDTPPLPPGNRQNGNGPGIDPNGG